MKVIGLIGGLSWVSTEHYYRLINEDVAARLGGQHCARLVLWQADFADVVVLQVEGRWDEAGELLAEGTKALRAAGAEVIGIGANTMHLVADQVREAAAPARLVHIAEAVRDACTAASITRIGLFGTAYTMASPDLYPPILRTAGIETLVPDAAAQAEIQRITYDELTRDVVTDASRAFFRETARALIAQGADAIVLACTEHGMVLGPDDLAPVPVLDTAVLHARALVDAALATE
ncbi:MAG: amino acid racemase [Solirubrobacteraceae bacterium]|nr:amino acid racemase [Solirubrobacteraceae bacterium]